MRWNKNVVIIIIIIIVVVVAVAMWKRLKRRLLLDPVSIYGLMSVNCFVDNTRFFRDVR